MFKKAKKSIAVGAAERDLDALPDWLAGLREDDEGHLSVDVYQTADQLIVKSTIAGALPQDLSVSVAGDVLTIKGERRLTDEVDYKDYLYRECYWGKFSRTVILPMPIDEARVEAALENGVLTVVLPKKLAVKERSIAVKPEL